MGWNIFLVHYLHWLGQMSLGRVLIVAQLLSTSVGGIILEEADIKRMLKMNPRVFAKNGTAFDSEVVL